MNQKTPLRAVIVYDNNPYDQRLQTDWGFSCNLEGLEKVILFDCGTKGQILLSNLEKLGLKPEKIEVVVLSHFHHDHTGGLSELLARNSSLEVWLPEFFPNDFKEAIRKKGARVVEVTQPAQICPGALTTGVIEGPIKEQSLVLESDKGLVLITGCAHPGIIKIIESVKSRHKKDIYCVFGGFHLGGLQPSEIKAIIAGFRRLGLKKSGPGHCSGDAARRLFSEEYGSDFVKIGVGREIIF
ncbi:MAG: MBL fold metallo-hydrolase [Candidatus Aminicenantes bacterium]|nr:MBL fold metallo-hydrolase [Candidatus Aminicenantes bacterium]